MIVSFNGFTLNDPSNANNVYLDEPISGLSLPPVRTSTGDYSGRNGGWVGAQYFGMRSISLTGYIFASSVSAFETTRRAFENACAAQVGGQPSAIPVSITTNAGNQYVVYCYVDSLDIPIQRATTQSPFQLSLIAADPVIYDDSAGGAQSAPISPVQGGGITWPIVWPIVWAPGGTPTTITNSGTVNAYPVITLSNQMTNPVITNVTTGQTIQIDGLTTTAGDEVVIDMLNRTVLLNGGSILSYLNASSRWWPLVPGSNSIKLSTGNSSDTVTGVLTWRNGYWGI